MISAKVVADSKNEFGNRITTMVVTMPRIILAEFNTHRMFSRNSASSRAIPFNKMVESVRANPFIPMAWQKDHTGMQGVEYLGDKESSFALQTWINAKEDAIAGATLLSQTDGVTKQLCNRLLEPFMWHTVIVTATEWENFFALRCPRYEYIEKSGREAGATQYFRSKRDWLKFQDKPYHLNDDVHFITGEPYWWKINKGQAEIHMMALAEAMWDAYQESQPRQLEAGEWHVPFFDQILDQYFPDIIDSFNIDGLTLPMSVKISTVMCARTSYTVVGEDLKPMSYERMIELHDKMKKADPKHLSPFEHCAPAMTKDEYKNNHIRISLNGEEDIEPWMTREEDSGKSVIVYDNADPLIGKPIWLQQYGWLGNFRGFKQYRKTIKGENII